MREQEVTRGNEWGISFDKIPPEMRLYDVGELKLNIRELYVLININNRKFILKEGIGYDVYCYGKTFGPYHRAISKELQ